MRYGPGWYDTEPEAMRLADEVFNAPWPPGLGLGAQTSVARPASPKESALEELPLIAGFPKESFPQENGSSRGSSPWASNRSGFKIDPAEIREGRFDPKAVNANEDFIRVVLPLFGLTDLDTPARCCLPGGTGKASIVPSKRGHYLYCCPCHKNGQGRSVTDAYAAKTSGRTVRRTGTVYLLWTVRLLAELGLVDPAPVGLAPLPADADENTRIVYEGLRLLLGLRGLTTMAGTDFTFSRGFVADWCGLTTDQACAGIKALRKAEIIVKTGTTKVGGHDANLYRVGGSERHA